MRLRRLAKIVAMTVTLSLLGANCLPAHATQMDSGATVQIKVDDLREVVIYTETLEAENAQMKQSLESERAAIDDLIVKQEQERQAQAEYAAALNAELQKAQADNKAVRRRGTVKNCLIVGLAGALIAVIATR